MGSLHNPKTMIAKDVTPKLNFIWIGISIGRESDGVGAWRKTRSKILTKYANVSIVESNTAPTAT